jgi:hypothetical protein
MAAAIRILYVDDEPELLDIGKLFPDSREVTVGKTLLMFGRITPGSV